MTEKPSMTTTLRLNDDLKRACDEILDDIGISFSAAVTIFMNEVVRTGGIPFMVRSPKAVGPAKDIEARAGQESERRQEE